MVCKATAVCKATEVCKATVQFALQTAVVLLCKATAVCNETAACTATTGLIMGNCRVNSNSYRVYAGLDVVHGEPLRAESLHQVQRRE